MFISRVVMHPKELLCCCDGSPYFLLGIHVLEIFVVVKVGAETVIGTNGEVGKCYFCVLEL